MRQRQGCRSHTATAIHFAPAVISLCRDANITARLCRHPTLAEKHLYQWDRSLNLVPKPSGLSAEALVRVEGQGTVASGLLGRPASESGTFCPGEEAHARGDRGRRALMLTLLLSAEHFPRACGKEAGKLTSAEGEKR